MKGLPGQLAPGERVEALATGQHDKRAGLLVATDRRLIFLTKLLFSSSSEDFPYSRISSVSAVQDGMFGGLTVHAQGRDVEFSRMDRQVGQELVNAVRGAL